MEAHGRKIDAYDGLRGAACILVVLGHLWTIVPADTLDQTWAFRGFFRSGSLAVTVFLILGAFLVTRGLLNRVDDGSLDIGVFWMRRLVRIGAQLCPFVIVVLVVSWIDRWDEWSATQTQRSLIGISTFTFNLNLVNDDPTANRPDLGHLWYLSVEQQFYLAWTFVLVWFGRFRGLLVVTLAAAAAAVMAWRFRVFDRDGWWRASLQTTTRSDGLLLGAMAALVYPRVQVFRRYAAVVALVSLGAAVLLIAWSARLDEFAYLHGQGVVVAVVTTVLVLSLAVSADGRTLAARLLSVPLLRFVGRVSFPLYIWHYPVFWASSRWARDLDWRPRAIASCVVLAVIVAMTDRFIERPIMSWLSVNRARAAPRFAHD